MRNLLWGVFFAFVAVALFTNWSPQLLQFNGMVGITRLVLIAVWVGFLVYSLYCSAHENIFRTIGGMSRLYWGRQVIFDLYISVFLSVSVVYLVTGSIVQTLLWALAMIPFANLAILLFLILHLDTIFAAFASAPALP
ncbi:MAG: hypothetical protein AAF224_02150 [Pseudomonadota bacterium]